LYQENRDSTSRCCRCLAKESPRCRITFMGSKFFQKLPLLSLFCSVSHRGYRIIVETNACAIVSVNLILFLVENQTRDVIFLFSFSSSFFLFFSLFLFFREDRFGIELTGNPVLILNRAKSILRVISLGNYERTHTHTHTQREHWSRLTNERNPTSHEIILYRTRVST